MLFRKCAVCHTSTLRKIQTTATLSISGVFYSSLESTLDMLLHLPLLKIWNKEEAVAIYVRLRD